VKSSLAIRIATLSILVSPFAMAQHTAHAAPAASAASPAPKLQAAMRTLWRECVAKTRA
jgi:hypothetical protein